MPDSAEKKPGFTVDIEFEIAQEVNALERRNFEGRNLPPNAIHAIVRAALQKAEGRGDDET